MNVERSESRPVRGVIYAALSIPFLLFAAVAAYFGYIGKVPLSGAWTIGLYSALPGFICAWRSWCNFNGTWDGLREILKGPLGKVILASVIAAKGLSDLSVAHIKFFDANPVIVRVGWLACVLAPMIAWLRLKLQARNAAGEPGLRSESDAK